jgi:hypothetical protein
MSNPAETPTVEELTARIRSRGPAGTASADEVAAMIREERNRR